MCGKEGERSELWATGFLECCSELLAKEMHMLTLVWGGGSLMRGLPHASISSFEARSKLLTER